MTDASRDIDDLNTYPEADHAPLPWGEAYRLFLELTEARKRLGAERKDQ